MTSTMINSDMMTGGDDEKDEDAVPSHPSHDFDFSGFDKTVRTQPSLRSADDEEEDTVADMTSDMMTSGDDEEDEDDKPAHTPSHGHAPTPAPTLAHVPYNHHRDDEEEEDMSSSVMSSGDMSSSVAEDDIDGYFAKHYPELVTEDYSDPAKFAEIDAYFAHHYPDLVDADATEPFYDAHNPAEHSDLHKHEDMRQALTTLLADIASSKSTMVDSVTNADVLNKAMLEAKLEELEIETLQKCNDEI